MLFRSYIRTLLLWSSALFIGACSVNLIQGVIGIVLFQHRCTLTFQSNGVRFFDFTLFLKRSGFLKIAIFAYTKAIHMKRLFLFIAALAGMVSCSGSIPADLRSIYSILCQEYPDEFDKKTALEIIRKVLKEERES